MILLTMGVAMLWFADNADFVKTSTEQVEDGYEWNYVGPTDASGVPAILINDKYYLWKLQK